MTKLNQYKKVISPEIVLAFFSLCIIILGIIITIMFRHNRTGDSFFVFGNYLATFFLLFHQIINGNLRKSKLGMLIMILASSIPFILLIGIDWKHGVTLSKTISVTTFSLYLIEIANRNNKELILIWKAIWASLIFIIIPFFIENQENKYITALVSTGILTIITILKLKEKYETTVAKPTVWDL